MNKTQKKAWYNLVRVLLCILIVIWSFIVSFILPLSRFWHLVMPLGIPCVFVVTSFFLRKQQSPVEVDSDERDEVIKKRAVSISFVSAWILLAAATVIPLFVMGLEGSIAVLLLAFINLGVLFGALLVHSVAILVQYGRGGKDGEK